MQFSNNLGLVLCWDTPGVSARSTWRPSRPPTFSLKASGCLATNQPTKGTSWRTERGPYNFNLKFKWQLQLATWLAGSLPEDHVLKIKSVVSTTPDFSTWRLVIFGRHFRSFLHHLSIVKERLPFISHDIPIFQCDNYRIKTVLHNVCGDPSPLSRLQTILPLCVPFGHLQLSLPDILLRKGLRLSWTPQKCFHLKYNNLFTFSSNQ